MESPANFAGMHARLVAIARDRVGNGEISESRLARLAGASQPHIHNVLKGIRKLSPELADGVMKQLHISADDLVKGERPLPTLALRCVPLLAGAVGQAMKEFDPRRIAGTIHVPAAVASGAGRLLAMKLGRGSHARHFEPGDLVVIDQSLGPRNLLAPEASYLVQTSEGPGVRYLQIGKRGVYMSREKDGARPDRWEPINSAFGEPQRPVFGRVVWVSRVLADL